MTWGVRMRACPCVSKIHHDNAQAHPASYATLHHGNRHRAVVPGVGGVFGVVALDPHVPRWHLQRHTTRRTSTPPTAGRRHPCTGASARTHTRRPDPSRTTSFSCQQNQHAHRHDERRARARARAAAPQTTHESKHALAHRLPFDVGRVGDDDVVALQFAEPPKQLHAHTTTNSEQCTRGAKDCQAAREKPCQ